LKIVLPVLYLQLHGLRLGRLNSPDENKLRSDEAFQPVAMLEQPTSLGDFGACSQLLDLIIPLTPCAIRFIMISLSRSSRDTLVIIEGVNNNALQKLSQKRGNHNRILVGPSESHPTKLRVNNSRPETHVAARVHRATWDCLQSEERKKTSFIRVHHPIQVPSAIPS
jgi:hypothetical protein